VVKAINLEALSKWVGQIPEDVVRDMKDIAPMLEILGYDATANPPDYEKSEFRINYLKLQNYQFKNQPSDNFE
jgi:protein-tyrosine sulfotransferase